MKGNDNRPMARTDPLEEGAFRRDLDEGFEALAYCMVYRFGRQQTSSFGEAIGLLIALYAGMSWDPADLDVSVCFRHAERLPDFYGVARPPGGGVRARPGSELPPWYNRLTALTIDEDREVSPEDFDADLSDIDEVDENSERDSDAIDANCECGLEGPECECRLYPAAADTSSAWSYDGSDAEFYYELRDDREERKRELRDMTERGRTERQRQRELESSREEIVQAAYELLRQTEHKGCRPRLDPIAGKTFYLFSADHADRCYNPTYPELYPTKYVEFYNLHDEQPPSEDGKPPDDHTKVQGHVYFNASCGCDFDTFCPPTQASQASYPVMSSDEKHELLFQFISNDFLTMTASRKLVCPEDTQAALAPELFRFVGIRSDLERDRRRQQEQQRLRRPPSLLELVGAGFDKPANTAYYTLRFPRVLKIHDDRSFGDTISFKELQEMAQNCLAMPDKAQREEKHWRERLCGQQQIDEE
ncbi:hypothetical protein PCL_09578 [Purpureocillium lilacinum]|uniref:Uncharacterized protein n=1 Tax=Purpureocillium lilacinum TaxID=33203 RepID=A0A2U3DQL0_PURLI|nr:hypothetical protein PCL_09578 [Purpureocillium lilacinum]